MKIAEVLEIREAKKKEKSEQVKNWKKTGLQEMS